jgi:hypothetical protein
MENEELEMTPETEPEQELKQVYVPRPAWQVWGARIGLAVVIISIALYYWYIASGGGR